jgi:hypothetical protein
MFNERLRPRTWVADNHLLDAGQGGELLCHRSSIVSGTQEVDIGASVDGEINRQPGLSPLPHGMDDLDRARLPVEQAGRASHHHGVHRQGILFDDWP